MLLQGEGVMLQLRDQYPVEVPPIFTQDLLGSNLNMLAAEPAVVDGLILRASRQTQSGMANSTVNADMMIRHKYGDPVPVNMRLDMGGERDRRLLSLGE